MITDFVSSSVTEAEPEVRTFGHLSEALPVIFHEMFYLYIFGHLDNSGDLSISSTCSTINHRVVKFFDSLGRLEPLLVLEGLIRVWNEERLDCHVRSSKYWTDRK